MYIFIVSYLTIFTVNYLFVLTVNYHNPQYQLPVYLYLLCQLSPFTVNYLFIFTVNYIPLSIIYIFAGNHFTIFTDISIFNRELFYSSTCKKECTVKQIVLRIEDMCVLIFLLFQTIGWGCVCLFTWRWYWWVGHQHKHATTAFTRWSRSTGSSHCGWADT